jgi:hypothetical protein
MATPVWPVVDFGSGCLVDNRLDKMIGRKILGTVSVGLHD